MGAVLLLPASEPGLVAVRAELAERIPGAVAVVAADGPDSAWTARVCAALPFTGVSPPLSIVGFGREAALLPAVALALRTRHMAVEEYVLIDADPPTVSDGWPDAPVRAFTDRPDPTLHLRGWRADPLAAAAGWLPSVASE